jgi:inner membrane protein
MPTILGHAAVPLAIGLAAGGRRVPPRLLLAGVAAAMLPDADVALHFLVDAPWGSPWRHRGFTHSLPFALVAGLLAALGARGLRARPVVAFAFVALACASHGLLDMLTTGGAASRTCGR